MLTILYELYYRVKTYFKNVFNINDNAFDFTKVNKITKEKILRFESEHKDLYDQIDTKYMYKMLKIINIDFDITTSLDKIIVYLTYESKFILTNKDNLEVSINQIKQNTIVLELIHKFKILEDIRNSENEIKNI